MFKKFVGAENDYSEGRRPGTGMGFGRFWSGEFQQKSQDLFLFLDRKVVQLFADLLAMNLCRIIIFEAKKYIRYPFLQTIDITKPKSINSYFNSGAVIVRTAFPSCFFGSKAEVIEGAIMGLFIIDPERIHQNALGVHLYFLIQSFGEVPVLIGNGGGVNIQRKCTFFPCQNLD